MLNQSIDDTGYAELSDPAVRLRDNDPFDRISDMAVVPYRQDQAPRLDFWGSNIRNHTTEGDTLKAGAPVGFPSSAAPADGGWERNNVG